MKLVPFQLPKLMISSLKTWCYIGCYILGLSFNLLIKTRGLGMFLTPAPGTNSD